MTAKPTLRGRSVLLLAAFLAVSSPVFAFKSYSFFGGNVHEQITRAALSGEVEEDSMKLIGGGNTSQDLIPVYFFEERRHFDNKELDEGLDYVRGEFTAALEHAGDADQSAAARKEALKAVGRMFHTLQDFYSHSNYVELCLEKGADPLSIKPILPFEGEWEKPEGLTTGYFDGAEIGSRSAALSRVRERYKGVYLGIPAADAYKRMRKDNFESAVHYVTANHEVLHYDLNKDDEKSPQGKIVEPKSGLTLFRIARTLAAEETRRWWDHYLKEVRAKYGSRAPKIIEALTGKKQPEILLEKTKPASAPVLPEKPMTFLAVAQDEKGVPVPNVKFVLAGRSAAAVEGPDGAANFSDALPGNYVLKAWADGFEPGELSFKVAPDMEFVRDRLPGVKITLKKIPVKTYDFLVSVTDENGKLVPDATVALTGPHPAGATTPMGQVRFTEIPAGAYALKAEAKGYSGAEMPLAVNSNLVSGGKAEVSIKLKKLPDEKIDFLVSVVDEEGDRVRNVHLELMGPSAGSGTTATGQMIFASTPVGAYKLRASAKGYKDEQLIFVAGPHMSVSDGRKSVTLTLKRAGEKIDFSVLAFDAQGNPVPDVTISLAGPASGSATGPRGRVDFSGFPSGQYTVRASAKGFEDEETPLTVEAGMQSVGGRNGISILMERRLN